MTTGLTKSYLTQLVGNKKHALLSSIFALSIIALSYPWFMPPALATATKPGAKHPVAQLVEWELTANSELTLSSLRRFAEVILDRAEISEIPKEILNRSQVKEFRNAESFSRSQILEKLTKADLERLVLIPAYVEYFEIPKNQLAKFAKKFPHELKIPGLKLAKEYFEFTKAGVPYVRWYLHPLAPSADSAFAQAYYETFRRRLVPTSGFAKFNFTSSRSLILLRDSYDNAISVKLSLPKAEGRFKDKKIHLKEFSAWGRHNKYLADAAPHALPHLKLLREPLGHGIGLEHETEDAILFRHLEVDAKEKYYLPAFSALNDSTGRAIAEVNGSNNPLTFWEEHLLDPLAKAMAELRANTGAEHTSPHSQNLLVELDKGLKPTGRIVLRDSDFYIDKIIHETLDRSSQPTEGIVRPGIQSHIFSLRNGMTTLPSWMQDKDYNSWVLKYFKTFTEHYASVTGIPLTSLNTVPQVYLGSWQSISRFGFYKDGGQASFYQVDFSQAINFHTQHANWLQKRKLALYEEQLAGGNKTQAQTKKLAIGNNPATRKSRSANPDRTFSFESWKDFIDELTYAESFDDFSERLSILTEDSKKLPLTERKELLSLLENIGIEKKISATKNPKAILAAARILDSIEPIYTHSHFKDLPAKLKIEKANAKQVKEGEKIINLSSENAKSIIAIQHGDSSGLAANLKTAETSLKNLYPSLFDALTYRFTNASNEEKVFLAGKLYELGGGDKHVESFLLKDLPSLPDYLDNKIYLAIKQKTPNSLPSRSSCQKSFSTFSLAR